MANDKVFSKVGQRSRSQDHNLWYRWKGLVIRISHIPNMKDLSQRVKKLWPMLKFFDGQTEGRTEGQTDRVITIGHPPSGGALMTLVIWSF